MYENQTIRQTAIQLETDIKNGLTEKEARARQSKNGYNELKDEDKRSVLSMVFEQLNEPLIYVLLVAAAASLFLHELGDTLIILVVVAMNATVGVIQEGKAQRALEALKKLQSPHALVLRDGQYHKVEARLLVPGDIVKVTAGDQIPADLRLISTSSLKVDESALTGESLPAGKDALYMPPAGKTAIGDRKNMAYMSTGVAAGSGIGIVAGCGMDTEIGKIAGMLHATPNQDTPLQKRLGELGKFLSLIAVALCALLFFIAVLSHRNIPEMLMTAISLAVAAVPEGLPAIVTIVLALSVSRMVKVNTIIRRLPCVETLGAVNVVCSDKTGTLTENQMTVTKIYSDMEFTDIEDFGTKDVGFLSLGFLLCNDAAISGEERIGDPTELALVDFGSKCGLNKEQEDQQKERLGEIPFDSARKMMTTLHRVDGRYIAFTKGSCDVLLSRCSHICIHGKVRPLAMAERRKIIAAMEQMSAQALRVLALAYREYSGPPAAHGNAGPSGGGALSGQSAALPAAGGSGQAAFGRAPGPGLTEKELIFVGMVGMIDPPRPGVRQAVDEFRAAGVRTVMITGDHGDTALAIARPLGIARTRKECMTGSQMDAMSDAELGAVMDSICVFARVSPEHKVRIVRLLKERGNIVAMTGDGVNDAPALKAADIGIAMGKNGTDTARNASDMILADDNFATIKKAIEEGRAIYGNIKKAILFLLSSNFGEIITMFAAVLLGLGSPLKASHILWINLITDSLPALALGIDKNDTRQLMRRPPRKATEGLFADGGLFCTLFYGALIALISLAAFLMVPLGMLKGSGISLTAVQGLLEDPLILARCQTYAFTVLGMSQLFHAAGMRNVERSVFRMNPLSNKLLLGAAFFGVGLQLLVTEVPLLVSAFGTVRLAGNEWGLLLLLAAMPLVAHELLLMRLPAALGKQKTAWQSPKR